MQGLHQLSEPLCSECLSWGSIAAPLADPGCTHSNSPTGSFSWLGMGLNSAGKIFPFSLFPPQAHKPLLLHVPCSNFRSMPNTLADILAGYPQYLKAAHGW